MPIQSPSGFVQFPTWVPPQVEKKAGLSIPITLRYVQCLGSEALSATVPPRSFTNFQGPSRSSAVIMPIRMTTLPGTVWVM